MTPKLLGILNIRPDSFSPGTAYYEKGLPAVNLIMEMVRNGADIIDLGAEAMCPGSKRISPKEERARLEQVLEPLIAQREKAGTDFGISIDTRNASTADWAINMGANIINDVSACAEGEMKDVLVKHKHIPYIFMHNLGTPPDKSITIPLHDDVIHSVSDWAIRKMEELTKATIDHDRLIFDPGIAFGKTARQSLDLIYRANELHALGIPLCYGHSRKTYVAPYEGLSVPERDGLTAGLSQYLAKMGVQYLRVHDVSTNHAAVRDTKMMLSTDWYEQFKEGLAMRSAKRDIEV